MWYNGIMVNNLIKLIKDNRELTLLEIAYFALSLLSFAVAGVVALFNQSLGVSVLIVPLVALVAGVMNVIAWALVKLVMEQIISSRSGKKSAEKASSSAVSKAAKK